jgi:hypothetical protein
MGIGVQHNNLDGRTGINCHSIDAITGLETRLENIETINQTQQDDIDAITGLETRLENIETINQTQQDDIDTLLIDTTVDGGNFSDPGTIIYDGGAF